MLKFELKKIFKKRILLFFIFLSIILPIYKLSILKYGDMVIVDNEKFVNSIGQIFDRAEDKAISSDTLSDDEKKSFVSDLIDIKMDRSLNLDFDKLDKNSEDDSLEFRDVIFSYENKLLNLLEKYEIELSDEEKTAISWNRLEKELMIQNSTSLNNLSFWDRSNNPIRFIIFNSNFFFGILPIIFLLLIFIPNLSKEREDGSLLLLTSPVKRYKIIF